MWTPPLRESFAFTICLSQVLAVSVTLRNPRPGWRNILFISTTTTTLFMICWQFDQFSCCSHRRVPGHVCGLLSCANVPNKPRQYWAQVRKNSFTVRSVSQWDSLPKWKSETLLSSKINVLQKILNRTEFILRCDKLFPLFMQTI